MHTYPTIKMAPLEYPYLNPTLTLGQQQGPISALSGFRTTFPNVISQINHRSFRHNMYWCCQGYSHVKINWFMTMLRSMALAAAACHKIHFNISVHAIQRQEQTRSPRQAAILRARCTLCPASQKKRGQRNHGQSRQADPDKQCWPKGKRRKNNKNKLKINLRCVPQTHSAQWIPQTTQNSLGHDVSHWLGRVSIVIWISGASDGWSGKGRGVLVTQLINLRSHCFPGTTKTPLPHPHPPVTAPPRERQLHTLWTPTPAHIIKALNPHLCISIEHF